MWHNLETYKHDDGVKTQTNKLIFRTSEIADIALTEHDGIVVSATVTYRGINEDGQPSYITFNRSTSELHSRNVDLLEALAISLEQTPSYFRDEQGNVFPFDKIMYVNAAKNSLVIAAGIDIVLHPTKEWPVFINDYVNWLDLK